MSKPTLDEILITYVEANRHHAKQQLTQLIDDIIGESRPIPELKDTSIDSIVERSVRVGIEKILKIQRQRAKERGIEL